MSQEDSKTNSKDSLLESAEALFTAKGYTAVSTRELADHAGVNLGAIQYHFGSKAKLFIETILCLLDRKRANAFLISEDLESLSREDAALHLCRFIAQFLQDVLRFHERDVCRLMHRETLGATASEPEVFEALVSSVVDQFIKPIDGRLTRLLETIQPALTAEEMGLTVQSIIGQCSYYITHRPFAERLRGVNYSDEEMFAKVCQHVWKFSLLGIGMSLDEVSVVMERAKECLDAIRLEGEE
jgi:AcrR family transcriptional regulator